MTTVNKICVCRENYCSCVCQILYIITNYNDIFNVRRDNSVLLEIFIDKLKKVNEILNDSGFIVFKGLIEWMICSCFQSEKNLNN
jgi:hypothetical protein